VLQPSSQQTFLVLMHSCSIQNCLLPEPSRDCHMQNSTSFVLWLSKDST